MAFDSALQMASTVTRIGAFLQQELLGALRAVKNKLVGSSRHQNTLLHQTEFDFEDSCQMFVAQRLEDHSLVDAVHELRRKFSAGRLNRVALILFIEVVFDFHEPWRQTQNT